MSPEERALFEAGRLRTGEKRRGVMDGPRAARHGATSSGAGVEVPFIPPFPSKERRQASSRMQPRSSQQSARILEVGGKGGDRTSTARTSTSFAPRTVQAVWRSNRVCFCSDRRVGPRPVAPIKRRGGFVAHQGLTQDISMAIL